ncbi:COG3335: Transposase and inactivated derivatives [Arthrobacter rhombi]|uniref:COG3335: Transposase and inactivated derivatives n=1 Tax=Arthrobacter rhombi TaxID=71253 RepID=A0A1R4G8R5_9MICC|nr:COG3335: Transposase and inactivated derivatives [Arthrobacter rhombi]
MHFTPTYSSWINQVERLFAEVTRDLLQRSDHRSVQALEKDLREWVKDWNENPQAIHPAQNRRGDSRVHRKTIATN